MDRLAPCPACRRHFAGDACPFCGATVAPPSPIAARASGRLSRAAVFAGATLAGCWTSGTEAKAPDHVEVGSDHAEAKGGRISGTLTDTTNHQLLPYREITLTDHADPAHPRKLPTDAQGHFVFADVPPGEYELTWEPPMDARHPAHRTTTRVTAGGHVKLELTVAYPPMSTVPMPYGAPPARRRVV